MTKYKLIANPAACGGGSSRIILKTLELFKERGAVFDFELTRGPKDAERIARRACEACDVVVVIGGDGTVNETIPGMLYSQKPLGIVPGGSGNDFIKPLNIPNNVEKAVAVILSGKTRVIDVGRINDRYFANGVGMGFDAAVNQASCGINHSKRGLMLYLRALLKTLGKFDAVPMKISINGESIEQDLFLLTVGNGTTVGGGFKLTPHALVDDHLLDITMVKPMGTPTLLWHLPKVFLGTIDKVKKYVSVRRTTSLLVESESPVPIHVDGEVYSGQGNSYTIEIVPHALTVIGNF
jgi:diacylglycerol kinase (ATP)